jgi:hypothetical protein
MKGTDREGGWERVRIATVEEMRQIGRVAWYEEVLTDRERHKARQDCKAVLQRSCKVKPIDSLARTHAHTPIVARCMAE